MQKPAVLLVGGGQTGADLAPLFAAQGFDVVKSIGTEEGRVAFEAASFDAVVLAFDTAPAAELLQRGIRAFEDVPVVVAASGARRAVEALRAGAEDFLDWPGDPADVAQLAAKILAERARRDAHPPESRKGVALLGSSKAMLHVGDLIRRVASGNATVLIRGESGTGKELVARALHLEGPRAAAPFVKVHCAGIPESLLESELFGHERGAFTGATNRKPGRVEVAEGGTLFLDEIGDVSPAMQVKLLRLLSDREYERLGSNDTQRADVRFVAATHRDLEQMMRAGDFREDLFYRLNVVPIWLPPLRARRDDVALLARSFCQTFVEQHDKRGVNLSEEAIQLLSRERWPGNVRQLQNFIERLVVLCRGSVISSDDVASELSPPLMFATQGPLSGNGLAAPESTNDAPVSSVAGPLDVQIRQAERLALTQALEHAKGNRTLAARLLGVSRATLYAKLEEHGMSKRSA